MTANVASLAASQVITWSMALAWTFIVPRSIGPANMGLLVIATSVTSMVAVLIGFTTRDFLVREMVGGQDEPSGILRAALLTRLASIPLLFASAVGYAWIAGLDGTAQLVLFFMAGAMGCTMLIEPALASFQATERMQYMAYTDVANKSMQTLGGIVLAISGFGVVAIAGLNFSVAAFALVMALWWAHSVIGLRARPVTILPLLRRAIPYWVVAVFFVTYLWADGFLLGILVPAEVVGWYGAATRLFTTLMFVAAVIAAASLPRLIAAHSQGVAEMYQVARQPFEWVVILGLPLGVGLACVADDVVPLLYGPAYAGAVPALAILAVGIPLMYMNIMVNQLFIASGRPAVMARVLAVAAAVNVGLNLILIPLCQHRWANGAVGAATSLFLTECFQLLIGMILIGRHLLTRGTVRRMLIAVVATSVMAIAVLSADRVNLGLQVLLGVVAFAAVAAMLRLPTEDEWTLASRAGAGALHHTRRSRTSGLRE